MTQSQTNGRTVSLIVAYHEESHATEMRGNSLIKEFYSIQQDIQAAAMDKIVVVQDSWLKETGINLHLAPEFIYLVDDPLMHTGCLSQISPEEVAHSQLSNVLELTEEQGKDILIIGRQDFLISFLPLVDKIVSYRVRLPALSVSNPLAKDFVDAFDLGEEDIFVRRDGNLLIKVGVFPNKRKSNVVELTQPKPERKPIGSSIGKRGWVTLRDGSVVNPTWVKHILKDVLGESIIIRLNGTSAEIKLEEGDDADECIAELVELFDQRPQDVEYSPSNFDPYFSPLIGETIS